MAQKVIELCQQYDVRGLAYDRWKTAEMLRFFNDEGFMAQEGQGDGLCLKPWGQGTASMEPAVSAFERAVLDNELKHDGHPLLTWCVMNALVKMDEAGNRKFDKSKARFRIDGAVALAMAMGFRAIDLAEPQPISPWEDPNYNLLNLL